MIDTDKYEGHTEGPWHAVTHKDEEVWGGEAPECEYLIDIKSSLPSPLSVACIDNKWVDNTWELTLAHSTTGATTRVMIEANARLIADAPLLLAEVERLRRVINDVVVDLTVTNIGGPDGQGVAVKAALNTLSEVMYVD